MKKATLLIVIIIITPIIAGFYGALHDQLSYTISPEYFTKFKFEQFGLDPKLFGSVRETVAIVGFLATWWTGIFIGIGLGLMGLLFTDYKTMLKMVAKSILVTLGLAMITGLVGLVYGKVILSNAQLNWYFPDNLVDKANFIAVGSLHNFSYLGGLLGLFAGITYLIIQKKKIKAVANSVYNQLL
jgi:hypothetical protein